MLTNLSNPLSLLSRVLLAALFLPYGFSKLTGFAGAAGYIASKGLPLPEVGAVIAIAVELGGSIALVIGLGTRWVALAMAVFTFAASIFFHNFWALPADQVATNQLMFLKNMAIIGGLLMLVAHGAGAFSLDAKRDKT